MKSKLVKSLAGTERYIAELAKTLKGNDVLGLIGPLGAGKTTIVQMVSKILGVKQRPRSPSYTLLQPYELPKKVRGICTLAHVDAYRVSEADLMDAGLADYLADPNSLVIIEWADRVMGALPQGTLMLAVDPDPAHPSYRQLTISNKK
jgi:tRNA threonylcarbamoyladenosine biosynthesis protein TsaE